MSDVPPHIEYEFRRATAFIAVYDLWNVLDVSEEAVAALSAPHRHTLTTLMEAYPSLDPVIDENPVDVVEHDLEAMGLLDKPPIVQAVDWVHEFYEEEDVLPMELECQAEGYDE